MTLTANEHNIESRKAIERLGAKLDGILLNLKIMRNGRVCHFHQYSIIDAEWPEIKMRLSAFLNR